VLVFYRITLPKSVGKNRCYCASIPLFDIKEASSRKSPHDCGDSNQRPLTIKPYPMKIQFQVNLILEIRKISSNTNWRPTLTLKEIKTEKKIPIAI